MPRMTPAEGGESRKPRARAVTRKAEIIDAANRRRAEKAVDAGNLDAAIESADHSARTMARDVEQGETRSEIQTPRYRRYRGQAGDKG